MSLQAETVTQREMCLCDVIKQSAQSEQKRVVNEFF